MNAYDERVSLLAEQIRKAQEAGLIDPCVYCGVVANSVDHVPPQSARAKIISEGLTKRFPFSIVPACRECNSVLNKQGGWTVDERRAYIKKALKRRYAYVLKIPDWSDAELATLSPFLRQYTLDGLLVRDFIKKRIAY